MKQTTAGLARSFSGETIGLAIPHNALHAKWAARDRHGTFPLINATCGAIHVALAISASCIRAACLSPAPSFVAMKVLSLAPSRSRVVVTSIPIIITRLINFVWRFVSMNAYSKSLIGPKSSSLYIYEKQHTPRGGSL